MENSHGIFLSEEAPLLMDKAVPENEAEKAKKAKTERPILRLIGMWLWMKLTQP